MKFVMLVGASLFAATITFVTNWLALVPWRRAKDKHWTERARLSFPVRTAATSNLWVMPAALAMICMLVVPNRCPPWLLFVLGIALGTLAGTIPFDCELFPRIPFRELLRQAAVNSLIRFLLWLVFLAAATSMPSKFNFTALLIVLGVVLFCIIWARGGLVYVARKLVFFVSPSERLHRIVRETATRLNLAYDELWQIRSPLAQAYAVPGSRVLLFSDRLLELLSDKEIAAICAHELAHLAEPRRYYFQRYIVWLTFLPWILLKPVLQTFGPLGFFLLILPTLVTPMFYRAFSRKMEVPADTVAHSNEEEPGTYARALLRLHEDALLPAVLPKNRSTHPHLYDRLLAAGVTPDFPRPAPAAAMAWPGIVWSCLLGWSAMFLILRFTEQL